GRAGLRAGSSGRDGRPAIRRVFVGGFSGLAWIRIPGGFPKIRPCRWRSIALRPPAYEGERKGTVKSMAYGKAETVFPVKRRAFARFRTVAACVPSCSRLDPELASGWTPAAHGRNHAP